MGRVPPSTFNINMRKMAGFCGKVNWRSQRSTNRSLLSHPQENTCREAAMRGLMLTHSFNTVQVISRQVAGRAEETSTYSSSGFCTVNCRQTASNYQLSHLRPCWELNPDLRGGRPECYHSATVAPTDGQ